MEMNSNAREHFDTAAADDSSQQLVMRVLKLRWMGMETEADRAQIVLSRSARGCTFLAGPFDTD